MKNGSERREEGKRIEKLMSVQWDNTRKERGNEKEKSGRVEKRNLCKGILNGGRKERNRGKGREKKQRRRKERKRKRGKD